MSSSKFDDLASLDSTRRDWKIRVKIVRLWRGYTKQGQPFNNFNILLIDKEETKIQAFIPAKCNDTLEQKLALGNVCSITNFDVEMYKADDKFRTVMHDYRLIFGEDTKVKLLDDKEAKLPDDTFDFYDHADLLKIANENVYLTDVIGIIQNKDSLKLNQMVNRLGQPQTQLKFSITDGSSKVNVTLWDNTAKKIYEELQQPLEEPVIIILASAKVGKWKEEVDMSHVAATHFYLNRTHHTVKKIRKMLQDPVFSQRLEISKKEKTCELLDVGKLKKLGMEALQSNIITHLVIKYVDDKASWFVRVCTKCKQAVSTDGIHYTCKTCKRITPHPEKRFQISIVGADSTGGIEIKLNDRQVRILAGKRAQKIYDEQKGNTAFPLELKGLQNKEITVQVALKEENFLTKNTVYTAANICLGFMNVVPQQERTLSSANATTLKEDCSASTYHLDGISQLNVDSET